MNRSPLSGLATRLGGGELARRFYHAPRSAVRTALLEGGPIEQRRTERGRLAMVTAAKTLPPLQRAEGSPLVINFLSGARYWYQTAFCAWSLQRVSSRPIAPVVFDDGSFTEETMAGIARAVPATRFVSLAETEARLAENLPANRYPTLRARRLDYPHLRKLTDIHVGARGWSVVLDSDMLFFRQPELLLRWLAAPDRPCHMLDVADAYGYSPQLLAELAGQPVPSRVNVGVCGLDSGSIDWDRLEFQCRAMLDREGANYLQEQALTALLLAADQPLRLPREDYLVKPGLTEGRRPSAVLHHYVAESKRSYFQHGWRRVIEGD